MTPLSALAVSHNTTYQHRAGVWVFLNSLAHTHTRTYMHILSYYSVDSRGTCAEVQIENVMCANAFRTEVRLVLSFSVSQQWEHQPQYGKLERRAHYSG